MRVKIRHQTEYRYDAPVPYGLQQLRMTPKSSAGQSIIEWRTEIEGGHKELAFSDHNNNQVELLAVSPGSRSVTILSEGEVDTADTVGVIGRHSGFTPLWYFSRSTPSTKPGPQVRGLVRALPSGFESDAARLHALSAQILETVPYQVGETDFSTTAEQALTSGRGVCQDHAHIFISAARLLGYPARYVSGYLVIDGRVEQEAGHAWAEAHVDGLGWVGFDISSGVSPDERYVRVATGLDYGEAAPISGIIFGGQKESMVVQLQVQQ
ncbi:transglutaminase family protein [uncultured Brevundimonas sp.]|uniref:transglutaminase family protein n=1 Tax=uncultured Brevundimonas sp. TaxID=213418 RepID=UPI0030EFA52B|tara:strand:- start:3991 stop:4791 length:801 start_codon:yes stop_codon:yes gene_type:complete